MKELAISALQKLFNKEELTSEELSAIQMYFIVLFCNSSARYTIQTATTSNIYDMFISSLQEDLTHVYTNRFGL